MTQSKPARPSTLSMSKISYNRKQIRARLLKREGFSRRARRPLPLCRRKGKNEESSAFDIQLNSACDGSVNTKKCNVIFEPMKSGSISQKARRIWKKPSVVQFDKEVSVFHISSYRDYPKHTLDRLYSTRQEITENVKRNRIEFNAEGRDWRNVLEEESMLKDKSGEFLHPVHSLGLAAFRKKWYIPQRRRKLTCKQTQA